ncbi:MAG: tetratricopeptide repeat protein [Gammaproteobacteria bacterium]|nr:tetratricopeptide repeat protein [Gammaproteobacteria bacterium]
MSLLLDALKKAAQQKAQKSQQEAPSQRDSDETLIRTGADDISGFDVSETGRARAEETELDHSEIRNRLESDLSQRIAGDETGFDIPDTTNTDAGSAPQEPVSGDETGLDMADVTEYRSVSAPSDRVAGDETGLDIADVTEAAPRSTAPDPGASDDTGLNIPDVTKFRLETGHSVRADADETRLNIADITEARLAELSESMQIADDEIIILADEELTDFPEEFAVEASAPEGGGETDIGRPAGSADENELALMEQDREPDETSADEPESDAEVAPQADADEDQDLSLLLVDQTDTNVRTLLTDPGLPRTSTLLAADTDDTLDGFGLVETADHVTDAEQTVTESSAVTSSTQAIGGADDTRQEAAAVTQSTLTQAEVTSTRTYAPDNYDRTLMRPPDDNASKVFAGMMPDSDVVMTPDYAKKVFHSKTSAQRAQHYKIYAGVAVIILLSIGIFGAFEYQEESSEIDTSLRDLKRDPMPGVISTEKQDGVDLFAATDAETNARTIEIIKGANENVTSAETVASTEQPEAVAEVEAGEAEVEAEIASAAVTEAEVVSVEVQPTRIVETGPVVVASSIRSTAPPEAEAIDTGDNLHIISSSQVSETDTWLQEAYSAYQSGDYGLAMKRYNQVLEVDSNNRNALLARAAINIHEGYSEAAIQDYRRLLLANPKDSLAMSSLLSVASYSPGETETQLKLMIRDEPDSPYLNFALANAYGAQNRWLEAQAYYFKALKNNPQDPNYAYNLAVSLEHISQPGSAITYYRRALENFENGLATFNRDVVDQRLQLLGKL